MKKIVFVFLAVAMSTMFLFCAAGCNNKITEQQIGKAKTATDDCNELITKVKSDIDSISLYYKKGNSDFDFEFEKLKKAYLNSYETYNRQNSKYKKNDNSEAEAEAYILTLDSVKESLNEQIQFASQLKKKINNSTTASTP